MKISEIVSILEIAIPKKDSWTPESYGPQKSIKNFNADIQRILFCVTPTVEVVRYFNEHDYDLLISHHPFSVPVPQLIYHTALDCCRRGLNDMWCNFLAVKEAKHFDRNLGWFGKIEPITFQDLVKKIEVWLDHEIIGLNWSSKDIIESVCICTGLGGLVLKEAEQTGADCYILGELNYPVDSDSTIFSSILETGHTLSENIGVHLLRSLLPSIQIDLAPLDIDYFGHETCLGLKPVSLRRHYD